MNQTVKKTFTPFITSLALSLSSLAYAETEHLDHVIVTVDNTPILATDLANAVADTKQRFMAANQELPTDKRLTAQVLDSLILKTAQLNVIKRSGQSINDEAVNTAILEIANRQGFSSLTEFKVYLERKQTGGYAKLRKQLKEELIINELRQQQLAKRVKISEQDVDYFLRSPESKQLIEYKYRTYHFRVNIPAGISTDSQQKNALGLANVIKSDLDNDVSLNDILSKRQGENGLSIQGGDMGFHAEKSLPPYIKEQIINLNINGTTQPVIHKDGVHVAKLVEKTVAEAENVKQWNTRHILIKPNQLRSLAQSEQVINDLYEKIRNNASFEELANIYSDDAGSAKKGGSLDWVTEGQMVPEFEQVMMNTSEGDFSAPFQTQFGWHILKVDAIREKDMSEEFQRNLAKDTLYKRQSSRAIEDWRQELRNNSYIRFFDAKYKP